MIVLIDSDSLCYASAFSVEKKGKVVPDGKLKMYRQLDKMVDGILTDTGAEDYKMFLTGKGNFRCDIDPMYKANREGMRKPRLLIEAREFLRAAHDAIIVTDMEADDAVCIEATTLREQDIECCIAHIDKDIDQIAGWHYKWYAYGKPSKFYYQSELDGLICLYTQALTGDKVDNIMHFKDTETGTFKKDYGLGIVGAGKALEGEESELELYLKCLEHYLTWTKKSDGKPVTEEDLIRNMKLLYLWRKENDEWKKPE